MPQPPNDPYYPIHCLHAAMWTVCNNARTHLEEVPPPEDPREIFENASSAFRLLLDGPQSGSTRPHWVKRLLFLRTQDPELVRMLTPCYISSSRKMIIDWTPTDLGQYVASCHQKMLDHERAQIDQLEASTRKHQKKLPGSVSNNKLLGSSLAMLGRTGQSRLKTDLLPVTHYKCPKNSWGFGENKWRSNPQHHPQI